MSETLTRILSDKTLETLPMANPSKRLRGQAFRKAAEANAMEAEEEMEVKPIKPIKPVKLIGRKMRDICITITVDDLHKSFASVSSKNSAPASTDVEVEDGESSAYRLDTRARTT